MVLRETELNYLEFIWGISDLFIPSTLISSAEPVKREQKGAPIRLFMSSPRTNILPIKWARI